MTRLLLPAIVLLLGAATAFAIPPPDDGGGRLLFETDFENFDLPEDVLVPEVFGWEQDHSTIDRPRAMEARIKAGGPEGSRRCLRLLTR